MVTRLRDSSPALKRRRRAAGLGGHSSGLRLIAPRSFRTTRRATAVPRRQLDHAVTTANPDSTTGRTSIRRPMRSGAWHPEPSFPAHQRRLRGGVRHALSVPGTSTRGTLPIGNDPDMGTHHSSRESCLLGGHRGHSAKCVGPHWQRAEAEVATRPDTMQLGFWCSI
jgi:hypothetical protein